MRNLEIARMNLTGMDPDKRNRLRDYCSKVVLRSLLPDKPTEQELADAQLILGLIEEIS